MFKLFQTLDKVQSSYVHQIVRKRINEAAIFPSMVERNDTRVSNRSEYILSGLISSPANIFTYGVYLASTADLETLCYIRPLRFSSKKFALYAVSVTKNEVYLDWRYISIGIAIGVRL